MVALYVKGNSKHGEIIKTDICTATRVQLRLDYQRHNEREPGRRLKQKYQA